MPHWRCAAAPFGLKAGAEARPQVMADLPGARLRGSGRMSFLTMHVFAKSAFGQAMAS
jgi:hypothetical protein